ncbi:hypothetical protein BC826DRAFT_1039934 [Russula brevipes]|nr:hypothetical protein BC826DRAFT_1039934 [Russula brevipes]
MLADVRACQCIHFDPGPPKTAKTALVFESSRSARNGCSNSPGITTTLRHSPMVRRSVRYSRVLKK